MVVKISKLPLNLQLYIIEKMHFSEMKTFQESSIHAREAVKMAKPPIIDIPVIDFNTGDVTLNLRWQDHDDGQGFCTEEISCLWSEATKHENCPRFRSQRFGFHEITEMRFMEIVQIAENGHLIAKERSSVSIDSSVIQTYFFDFYRFLM